MNYEAVAPRLRCKICGSGVVTVGGRLVCSGDGHPWGDVSTVPFQEKAFVEKIFDFPAVYQKKVQVLGFLNGIPQNVLDPLVEGEVLDVGCGAYQYLYDPNRVPFRVGIDYSHGAISGANQMYPGSAHFVSSLVEPLPFQDKSFDMVLVLFVLHHLPIESVPMAIQEAARVARKHVLLVDHTKNKRKIPARIQQTYWDLVDGGTLYRKQEEWDELLKGFDVVEHRKMGTLFRNICLYKLAV